MTAPTTLDPMFTRAEIVARLRISSETMRRWERDKRMPPPDVAMTQKTRLWKLSTLHAAGLRI